MKLINELEAMRYIKFFGAPLQSPDLANVFPRLTAQGGTNGHPLLS
ncbi:MAG TPA: hypothetical protein VF207_08690 [Chthoniobacterales bacterium]